MNNIAIPFVDLAAFALFAVCWFAFTLLANHVFARRPSLLSEMRKFRHRWVEQMAMRDNHVADAALLSNLLRGALFFASTTVFILGGLVALLGTSSKVSEVIAQIPYATGADPRLAEIKGLILIFVYIYAFFKFTWSAWQYNILAILVGAMPKRDEHESESEQMREAATRVLVLAGENYNNGMRAYYFSIPLMAWLIDPVLLIAATLIVTIVLYRREFSSDVLAALLHARNAPQS